MASCNFSMLADGRSNKISDLVLAGDNEAYGNIDGVVLYSGDKTHVKRMLLDVSLSQ